MQPYLIASLAHVICSIGSLELVLVQPSFQLELLCVLTMCYLSDDVSSKENIKMIIN